VTALCLLVSYPAHHRRPWSGKTRPPNWPSRSSAVLRSFVAS